MDEEKQHQYIRRKSKYKKVGVLPIRIVWSYEHDIVMNSQNIDPDNRLGKTKDFNLLMHEMFGVQKNFP